jgi:hypothetical protein
MSHTVPSTSSTRPIARTSHQPSATTPGLAPPASLRLVVRPRSIAKNTPSAGLVRRPYRQYHLSRFGTKTDTKTGLALVGTVHFDRHSFHALKMLLNTLDSNVIATEMSEWGIAFRHERGRQLKGQLLRYVRRNGLTRHEAGELSALVLLLSFPHEYLAARAVSRATRVPLVHLGRNRDSRIWLGRLLKDPWDAHQLQRLSASGAQLEAKLSYERRRALLGDAVGIKPGLRDRLLSERLRDLLSSGVTVAAVMGWEHVCRKVTRNVASLLKPFNPAGFLVVDGKTVRLY